MKTLKSIWDWYTNGGIYLGAQDVQTGEEKTVLIPFKLIIPFVLAIIVAVLAIIYNSLIVGVVSVVLWAIFFLTYAAGRSPKKKDTGV
jgi:hypothetical protein